MKIYLKVADFLEIGKLINALILIGCSDIHIVDNTHLEGHGWEIEFTNYNLSDASSVVNQQQQVWKQVMEEIENGK